MTNKNLLKVKAMLDKQKAGIEQKKLSASLSHEQKTKLDETLAMINEAISELEAADTEATTEQITSIFSKVVESLQSANEQTNAENQAKVEAKIQSLQAKINLQNQNKKFRASLSLKRLKASNEATNEGFKHFSAGVDVEGYTPESEVDSVEIFHPTIGVVQGFTVSTTSSTSVKVRKFGTSGACTVVLKHNAAPELTMVGTQSIVNVDKYMGEVKGIADEDLEDESGLEQEIQSEALENLAAVENAAAITLLGGATAYSNAKYGKVEYPDIKSAMAGIIDQVKQGLGIRQSPIAFAMNSSNWAKAKDLRDANGYPIDITSVIGDVQQIVDNTLTDDNFFCWAKKYAAIKIYKPKKVDWYKGIHVTTEAGAITAVHSEWSTDESSVRVRQREVMYLRDTTTAVKGKISGVITAITL